MLFKKISTGLKIFMRTFEHYETERLLLRRFKQDDLVIFTAYRNQLEIARYQSWSSYSEKEAQDFFAQQKNLVFNTDIAIEGKTQK